MDRYKQTLDSIRQLIDGGAVATDGRLPTERELCNDLGVGRRILRRALETLEEEGRVYRRQGCGTFARVKPGRRSPKAGTSVADGEYLAPPDWQSP